MTPSDPKADLHRYLQQARENLVWKLDGLSEYDVRRPLVPTATNLLGLVKHVASVEAGYFGATFGRPFGEPLPWIEDGAEPNADLWATPEESREQIVGVGLGSGRGEAGGNRPVFAEPGAGGDDIEDLHHLGAEAPGVAGLAAGGVDVSQTGAHLFIDDHCAPGAVWAPALTSRSVSGRTPTETSTRSTSRL